MSLYEYIFNKKRVVTFKHHVKDYSNPYNVTSKAMEKIYCKDCYWTNDCNVCWAYTKECDFYYDNDAYSKKYCSAINAIGECKKYRESKDKVNPKEIKLRFAHCCICVRKKFYAEKIFSPHKGFCVIEKEDYVSGGIIDAQINRHDNNEDGNCKYFIRDNND